MSKKYRIQRDIEFIVETDLAKIAAKIRPKLPVTVCCAPNFALISDISDPFDQCTLIAPLQAPAATPQIALHMFPKPSKERKPSSLRY